MPRKPQPIETFAQRLIRFRKARGLSQYELADLSGISQRMVAHYETRIRNPASGTVLRLAKGLGVSAEELMGFKSTNLKQEIDRKTLKKVRLLSELPPKDQKTILRHIEDLKAKYQK